MVDQICMEPSLSRFTSLMDFSTSTSSGCFHFWHHSPSWFPTLLFHQEPSKQLWCFRTTSVLPHFTSGWPSWWFNRTKKNVSCFLCIRSSAFAGPSLSTSVRRSSSALKVLSWTSTLPRTTWTTQHSSLSLSSSSQFCSISQGSWRFTETIMHRWTPLWSWALHEIFLKIPILISLSMFVSAKIGIGIRRVSFYHQRDIRSDSSSLSFVECCQLIIAITRMPRKSFTNISTTGIERTGSCISKTSTIAIF